MQSNNPLLKDALKWTLKSTLVFFRKFSRGLLLNDEESYPEEFVNNWKTKYADQFF